MNTGSVRKRAAGIGRFRTIYDVVWWPKKDVSVLQGVSTGHTGTRLEYDLLPRSSEIEEKPYGVSYHIIRAVGLAVPGVQSHLAIFLTPD